MESSRPSHALMSALTESFILNNKVFRPFIGGIYSDEFIADFS